LFLSSFGTVAPASAPENNVVLTGIVTDAETAEPIVGALVWIEGVNKGAVTDGDGRYTIANLPEAGKYTLKLTYLAYKPVEVECEAHWPVTQMDISMVSDAQAIDEVVVSARIRSHTESGMVMTVRSIPQVASGVSAVQIAQGPDRIASEVVRRIPGVTLIDERFVVVRGLSQRYNNAWINGLGVPSTETDSRAFPFDLIPGSQIDHLMVYKSPSPEIPSDFAGGFVQLTSKSVPEENRIEGSYSAGMNLHTQGQAFRSSDDWRVVRSRTPWPDQRLSTTMARRWDTGAHGTVGNITALTYSRTPRRVGAMQNARYGIYSAEADRPVSLDDYLDDQFTTDLRTGLLHNWSFVPSASHRFEFRNLLNLVDRTRLTERRGVKDISSPYYLEQTEMLRVQRRTYSGQLSGTHSLATPGQSLAWNAGYSFAGKSEPDRRVITNQAGISDAAAVGSVETANDHIKRYRQQLRDHHVSAALNYQQPLAVEGITLKAGAYSEYRNRAYSQREYIYRYDRLTADERRTYLRLPVHEMLSGPYLDRVYLDEITRKTNAYSAVVMHVAGYGALEIALPKWLLYAGVRFENQYTRLTRDRSDAPEVILPTTKRRNEPDWFPSLNLNYKFADKQQLRMAYGRSVNRPELREISPSVYFDFDLFGEIGGNENLKPAHIHNLDLRYELYPAWGETLSAGVFYKHFRHPIEWTFIDMGGTLRYGYENAGRAESLGVELDLRKRLEGWGMPGFSITLNMAWIKSRVHFEPGEMVTEPDRPMQGQSPYILNAGLFYQHEASGLHASLLYNRIGKRIVGLGKSNSAEPNINTLIPDSYEMPRNMLDLTVSKALGKRMEIRLSAQDMLSEDVVYKQFPRFERGGVVYEREQIIRKYNPGASLSLGVSCIIN
jgi:outer membrane receptor protein involved in Fe transport